MGLYPIPWTAIQNYIDANEFSNDQAGDLFYFIRHMDEVWINHWEEKQRAKQTAIGKNPVGSTAQSRRVPARKSR